MPTGLSKNLQTLNIGRKSKLFSESSDVVKRRKTKQLRSKISADELLFAGQMKSRQEGESSKAKELLKVIQSSPKEPKSSLNKSYISYTDDEALALIISNKLTKRQYMAIRLGAKIKNVNLYPPYGNILEAKKRCYPENAEALIFNELSAAINLQDL